MGIGYSEGNDLIGHLIAISDFNNQRIEIYKIRRERYSHYSSISLSFKPRHLSFSSSADLILISDGYKVVIYKEYKEEFKNDFKEDKEEEREEEGKKKKKKREWKEDGEICSPPSLQPPLRSPLGIAINSSLNYCVICDGDHHRILFFNLTTRVLICSYQPTLSLPPLPSRSFSRPLSSSSNYYFQKACGISIDEEADLISVSDIGSHSISLFLSPIF